MTDQAKRNFIYSVSIHHLDNQFYVTPAVRMPPIGMSTQVLPLYIIPHNNIEEFSEAIETAMSQSDIKPSSKHAPSEREEWDGDNKRVWNTAKKSWSVFWDEDGAVIIAFAKPYRKYRKGVEWIYVKEAEKTLAPNASFSDIAEEILRQAKA